MEKKSRLGGNWAKHLGPMCLDDQSKHFKLHVTTEREPMKIIKHKGKMPENQGGELSV